MRQKLDAASISTCLADADSSGRHLIWDMPSSSPPDAGDSLQYSEFYFGKSAWAKSNVKHIIAADINGYSWYCLAMDPWYKGICIC